ncbi:epidermal growth factor receptor kinase substrate 8 isoform X2 [Trichomycterus rosablanca]|uniref:epidermal growth factor receptor kinase substrate 8 isoform X2 n=1 Tax=Trichomycterus rosablanca TaxID=2290929 RepID=UPI002F35E9F5
MFSSSSSYSYTDSLQSSCYFLDEISSQSSGLSRPSAKMIYTGVCCNAAQMFMVIPAVQGVCRCFTGVFSVVQRKEYAESINNQLTKFQHRVEHVFTCELDGEQVSGLQDCVERLKLLESTGRVWGQDMMLEVENQNLVLKDIESKEELECVSLRDVMEVGAVLDGSVFDSLLLILVHERRVRNVFMFQCDSLRADYIKRDLERVLHNLNNSNMKNHGGRQGGLKEKSHRNAPSSEWTPTPPNSGEWSPLDDDEVFQNPLTSRQESIYSDPELLTPPAPTVDQRPGPSPAPYTERERNIDVLNHLINDIEQFVDVLVAAVPTVNKKKKKKKQKNGLPSDEEFKICLQKFKMSFNLLASLNNHIHSPSAAELTHCLFNTLEMVVSRCADDLPPSVVAPLLEPQCVRFLSEEATAEEDQLWQLLGDAWNIPSSQWPEDDDKIPTFSPVFNDGWEPPEINNKPLNLKERLESSGSQSSRMTTQSTHTGEEAAVSVMKVLHDFRARNERELSVRRGELMEILDMSKQWWKVRNGLGEEGFIPNNVLGSTEMNGAQEAEPNPTLNRKSRPEEVKAWLEQRGFNKITVRCLGGLSGVMLLGMTQDELKVVCPEEGRRVYYQLLNIKTALTLNSEVRPLN